MNTARRLADEQRYREMQQEDRLSAMRPVRKSLKSLETHKAPVRKRAKNSHDGQTTEDKSESGRRISLRPLESPRFLVSPHAHTTVHSSSKLVPRLNLPLAGERQSGNPFGQPVGTQSERQKLKTRSSNSAASRVRPNRLSSKYMARFQRNFQQSLSHLSQAVSTDRLTVACARSELREFVIPKDTGVKVRQVREAVDAFRSEKLAFVYGVEFRGRYISRSHGDILKN